MMYIEGYLVGSTILELWRAFTVGFIIAWCDYSAYSFGFGMGTIPPYAKCGGKLLCESSPGLYRRWQPKRPNVATTSRGWHVGTMLGPRWSVFDVVKGATTWVSPRHVENPVPSCANVHL